MIFFENKGELDMRAVTVMGISAKDKSRDTIGFFGTGLKYAIAVLLRTGHEVFVQPGDGNEYTFQVKKTRFRDAEFDIIQMVSIVEDFEKADITELGYTTELGKQWETWEAFRELYCNAADEGGSVSAGDPMLRPMSEKGLVRIIVAGAKMEQIYAERGEYLLYESKRTPYWETPEVDFYEHNDEKYRRGVIFYRGVRVGKTPYISRFDYSIKTCIDLSEDRSVKYSFQVAGTIARAVLGSSIKKLVEYFAMPPKNTFEAELSYSFAGPQTPSETFLDTIGSLRERHSDRGIRPELVKYHQDARGIKSTLPTESVQLTDIEEQQLLRAKAFCRNALKIEIDDFPLIVAEHLGAEHTTAYGLADMDNSIIYLSRGAFRQGTKVLTFALIEEHTHLAHRVYDETYEQKMVYLEMIASLGEEILGEPL